MTRRGGLRAGFREPFELAVQRGEVTAREARFGVLELGIDRRLRLGLGHRRGAAWRAPGPSIKASRARPEARARPTTPRAARAPAPRAASALPPARPLRRSPAGP